MTDYQGARNVRTSFMKLTKAGSSRRRRWPLGRDRRCRVGTTRSARSPERPPRRGGAELANSMLRKATPSTLSPPAVGSYRRQINLARVVLPAPFRPTMASEVPAGTLTSSPAKTVHSLPGFRTTHHGRRCRTPAYPPRAPAREPNDLVVPSKGGAELRPRPVPRRDPAPR